MHIIHYYNIYSDKKCMTLYTERPYHNYCANQEQKHASTYQYKSFFLLVDHCSCIDNYI